jgi:hypothetical protein
MSSRATLADTLKQLVEAVRPDLRAFFRPSLLGKVVAVHEDEYRVDVVVGETEEDEGLALPKVPVSSLFAQDGYGVWALPEVGAEVTVSFHDGDVTQPYVEAPGYFTGAAPSGYSTGTIAIRGKHGQEVIIHPDADKVTIRSSQILVDGQVLLGGSGASGEPAACGNPVHQALSTILNVLKTVPLGMSTSPGSPIAPNPAVAGALAQADSAVAGLRSSTVFLAR